VATQPSVWHEKSVISAAAILSPLVIGLLAVATIPYWMLRSWRTAVLLLAAAGGIVAVEFSGLRPIAPIELGIVAGVALVMLGRNEQLWAMRASDRRFIESLASVRRDIRDLRQRLEGTDPREYVREFERIIDRLEAIPAPSEDWAALQADAAREYRSRLAVMRGATPTMTIDEADERLQRIEEGFADLIKAKTSFWLPWP
jgi:hypothetical protein